MFTVRPKSLPLILYRRHFRDGTLGGTFRRKNTKKTSWPEAKAVTAAWEAAARWDVNDAPAIQFISPPELAPPAARGDTIERVVSAFVAERSECSAPNTEKK